MSIVGQYRNRAVLIEKLALIKSGQLNIAIDVPTAATVMGCPGINEGRLEQGKFPRLRSGEMNTWRTYKTAAANLKGKVFPWFSLITVPRQHALIWISHLNPFPRPAWGFFRDFVHFSSCSTDLQVTSSVLSAKVGKTTGGIERIPSNASSGVSQYREIKSLNLELALHKSRFVEFTVKPARRANPARLP